MEFSTGSAAVVTPTPGLFTAHASGAGVVSAFYMRVRPDGSSQRNYVFDPQTLTPTPLDVSPAAASSIWSCSERGSLAEQDR